MPKPLTQTTGRRKAAVARVRLRPGQGAITVNRRPVEDYFPSATHRQIISEQWLALARTPTPAEPTYGFMNFFLNTQNKLLPSAPAGVFMHIGNGANLIYVDPEHDLVAVVRWIDNKAADGFVKRLLAAVDPR